jgi:hypothetical protein
LLHEVVVNDFANAEFKVVMGDYIFVQFTIPIRDLLPQPIPSDLTPTLTPIWKLTPIATE